MSALMFFLLSAVSGLSPPTQVDRRTALVGTGVSVASQLVVPAQAKEMNLGKIGIGAWAWGDTLFWGYDEKKDSELKETFEYLNGKAGFLDTAEVYGFGRSETLIGNFAKEIPNFQTPIATKFAALPWRTKADDVVKACEASMKRLDRSIDLYQIHFPNAWSNKEYWDGLVECVKKGYVGSVGVSNYGVDAVRECSNALESRGVKLQSNQIQYSLLYRYPEENGLLKACDDLNIDVLAYSPLGLGLLTNKFTLANGRLPDGPRAAIVTTYLENENFLKLQTTLDTIAKKHESTAAAVALNWCRAKKTIPIAGARTITQAKQNLQAATWDLSKEALQALDSAVAELPWLGIKPPFADKDIVTGLKMFDSYHSKPRWDENETRDVGR